MVGLERLDGFTVDNIWPPVDLSVPRASSGGNEIRIPDESVVDAGVKPFQSCQPRRRVDDWWFQRCASHWIFRQHLLGEHLLLPSEFGRRLSAGPTSRFLESVHHLVFQQRVNRRVHRQGLRGTRFDFHHADKLLLATS